jgi:hypothetical protein
MPVGRGHNRLRNPGQWQVPHLPQGAETEDSRERDLDLVEAAFADGFAAAADPTSFLRLARIPFVGIDSNGRRLHLLRVVIENLADVGSVVPLLGGEGFRYDPLPAQLASRRRHLAFVYHDGAAVRLLDFAEVRSLADETGSSHFELRTPAPTQ